MNCFRTNRISLCLAAVLTMLMCEPASALKSTGFPKYDRAVAGGVAYLKANAEKVNERETSLLAYALLKAGEPASSAIIQRGVEDALHRTEQGHSGYDRIYLAGVDAMLLSDVDADKYAPALQKIADFISANQHTSGGWSEGKTDADTSMAQYGMLALWAAHRAGAKIQPATVERNVQWHLKNGSTDGGWAYRPEKNPNASTHNLVCAGAGSLGIGRLLLYGPEKAPKKKEESKFGVLEKVKPKKEEQAPKFGFRGYTPQTSKGVIEGRVKRAFGWLNPRFPPPPNKNQPYYFFYALERAASLTNLGKVNGKDWFEAYGDVLLTMQAKDGGFDRGNTQYTTATIGTSFAILYFVRSTKQILGKAYGAGLLQASRGLPSDLSRAFDPDAPEAEKKVKLDPLDDLLAALEKAPQGDITDKDAEALAKKQQEIVQKIINGDREELVGEVDRLKTLATNPNAEVRRIALWALGRSGDMMVAPVLIKGLKDVDAAVMVEARFALCCVSRRANGFGLPSDPFEDLGGASQEEKTAAAIAWSDKVTSKWQRWWFKVRPYDMRDDLEEAAIAP